MRLTFIVHDFRQFQYRKRTIIRQFDFMFTLIPDFSALSILDSLTLKMAGSFDFVTRLGQTDDFKKSGTQSSKPT